MSRPRPWFDDVLYQHLSREQVDAIKRMVEEHYDHPTSPPCDGCHVVAAIAECAHLLEHLNSFVLLTGEN